MIPHGVHWYIGIPRSGKTALAYKLPPEAKEKSHLEELSASTGWPCLIIDSAGVGNFDHLEHVKVDGRLADEAITETVRKLWVEGKHATITPADADMVDRLVRAAGAGRRVHILIDEARNWCSNRYISPALSRLMRSWRHSQVTIHLTTQYFGDINSEGLSCGPHLWVFRSTAPMVLERLEREFGMDPEKVRTLPQYEYLHHYEGF